MEVSRLVWSREMPPAPGRVPVHGGSIWGACACDVEEMVVAMPMAATAVAMMASQRIMRKLKLEFVFISTSALIV